MIDPRRLIADSANAVQMYFASWILTIQYLKRVFGEPTQKPRRNPPDYK